MTFAAVAEQSDAKRLLSAALTDGPAHAYLLHGPPGVGKKELARLFAAELLGDHARVERGTHPDLYVLEPLGDQIRIDDIRTLRRDLHMRPFEASRRVYLIFGRRHDERGRSGRAAQGSRGAAVVRRDRADRERPRPAAGDDPLALPARAVPSTLGARRARRGAQATRPELSDEEATTIARVAAGRLDRAARLLDPAAAQRREALLEVARAVYLDPAFDAGDGAQTLLAGIGERGLEAKERAEDSVAVLELTGREAEQRVRRSQRGAERDELLATLEELEWWYRDLVVVAAGAEGCGRPRRPARAAARRRDPRAAPGRGAGVRGRPRGLAGGRGAPALGAARARGAPRAAPPRARRPGARPRLIPLHGPQVFEPRRL